jgi:hypothetical protein
MSARSLVVHKAVHPYRVAALNRWRAIVEAAARGESVSAEQERALYEAEMDAHDTMLSALAAPMSATPEGEGSIHLAAMTYSRAMRDAVHVGSTAAIAAAMREAQQDFDAAIAAHVAARVGEAVPACVRELVRQEVEAADSLASQGIEVGRPDMREYDRERTEVMRAWLAATPEAR